jgi:hypothetical protein
MGPGGDIEINTETGGSPLVMAAAEQQMIVDKPRAVVIIVAISNLCGVLGQLISSVRPKV